VFVHPDCDSRILTKFAAAPKISIEADPQFGAQQAKVQHKIEIKKFGLLTSSRAAFSNCKQVEKKTGQTQQQPTPKKDL